MELFIYNILQCLRKKVQLIILIMQKDQPPKITYRARAIITNLKTQLSHMKRSLQNSLTIHFGQYKSILHSQQFHNWLESILSEIKSTDSSCLYKELELYQNKGVFMNFFQDIFDDIDVQNHDSLIFENVPKEEIEQIQQDVILALTQSEKAMQMLQKQIIEKNGSLSHQILLQILKQIQMTDDYRQTIFLKHAFSTKKSITIDSLLHMPASQPKQQTKSKTTQKVKIKPEVTEIQVIQKVQKEAEQQQYFFPQNRSYPWTRQELSYIKGDIIYPESQYLHTDQIPKSLLTFINSDVSIQPLFAQIATNHLEKNLDFIDKFNPENSKALTKFHITSQYQDSYYLFNPNEQYILKKKQANWFNQLIDIKDIKQGNVGNCYFLSALPGIIRNFPFLLHRLFIMKKNPAHLYGVRLFIQGKWKTIMLDASFPLGRKQTFCCAQPQNRQIWVMLLQKAWAKVYGSYDAIKGGGVHQGLEAVSGAPTLILCSHHPFLTQIAHLQLSRGAILSCSTSPLLNNYTKRQQEEIGLFKNHAYSLLCIFLNIQTANGKQTLFQLRNPWGKKQWKGEWNFNSPLWTPQLRKKLNYEHYTNDGTFFMNKKDFIKYFQRICIAFLDFQYKNSYIEYNNSEHQFEETHLEILSQGIYYFTIYQQNPRRYLKKDVIIYSNSWIFLLKQQQDKYIAITSQFSSTFQNTIKVNLEPGKYIILAKVQWQKQQNRFLTITSYGPQHIIFKRIQKWNVNTLSQFIQNKNQKQEGQFKQSVNLGIAKRQFFSPNQGYGFYWIRNNQTTILKVRIKYQNKNRQKPGFSVLPPHSLPIKLQMMPDQQILLKFFIHDPNEDGLHLVQKIKPIH